MLITTIPALSAAAIGGRDHDDVELLRDEIFHGIDLCGEVAFVLHPDSAELELIRVLPGVFFCPGLHLLEEFICQRLHDEADLRLLCLRREGRQAIAPEGRRCDAYCAQAEKMTTRKFKM
jgi:hypothetical protein